jgi:diguanylate cyclase (GGDEF)-like protein
MDEGVLIASPTRDISQEPRPSALRLLIIEDVPEDVELIALMLESAGISFTYDTASTAEHCYALLTKRTYDMVLSDYRLPNFNGIQVFELLKTANQDVPFILITGSLGEEAAVECIKTGMTDYVLKDRLFRLPMVVARALQEFELRRQQKLAIAQIQQQARRETIVNRIVQAMRKTLVLEAVLQTTVDQLREALQVSRCSIFQPKKHQDSKAYIQYLSPCNVLHQSLLGAPCDFYTYYREVLIHDQPVVIHSTAQEMPESMQAIAKAQNVHSMILMPLLYQQSYLGGICLQQCDYQRTWNEDEIALVKAITDQCAIAIHQAQLYQQAQKELAERQRIEAQLRHDAFHDALTGLPNRALLMNRLEHVLQLAQRHLIPSYKARPYQFAVLFLDVDRFKVVNDSLGHTVGDHLLNIVAQQLQACLRAGDTVARWGGDEFVMLLEDIQSATDALDVARRIHQALKDPIFLDGHEVFISASIGITFHSPHYTEPAQLLRDADIAMYRAKRRGRGTYEVFDASMHTHALRQLQLESDLQRAIEREELQVYYQPIMSLETNQVEGFEALVRWQHPEYGMVAPDEFIPIAEDAGLVELIDMWVLQESCRQLKVWQDALPQLPLLTINVNLSGKQFANTELIAQIDRVLDTIPISGAQIKLEITEGVLIENAENAAAILQQLRQRRIQVCLDDFGTGYSSLSYLHRFPINTLKIDRSFITALDAALTADKVETDKIEIVKAIVNLSLSLGLTVVAEGIETVQQLSYLRSIQCHAGQGYYFARPLTNDAAFQFLQQQEEAMCYKQDGYLT